MPSEGNSVQRSKSRKSYRKTFMLPEDAVAILSDIAKAERTSQTQVVINAIYHFEKPKSDTMAVIEEEMSHGFAKSEDQSKGLEHRLIILQTTLILFIEQYLRNTKPLDPPVADRVDDIGKRRFLNFAELLVEECQTDDQPIEQLIRKGLLPVGNVRS